MHKHLRRVESYGKTLTPEQIQMLVQAGRRINIKVTPTVTPEGKPAVDITDGQYDNFARAATELQMLSMQLVSHFHGLIG